MVGGCSERPDARQTLSQIPGRIARPKTASLIAIKSQPGKILNNLSLVNPAVKCHDEVRGVDTASFR